MQGGNRLFDDLAKVASGAASTLAGVKDEVEVLLRQRIESALSEMDLVPRDEFEAVKEIAANARAGQEKLEARVAELEAQLVKAKPASRKKTAKAKK